MFLSIRLFAGLFALSVALSAVLAYRIDGALVLAAKLPPEAAATLAARIQAIRLAGLGLAVLLALCVVVGARRGAAGRWRHDGCSAPEPASPFCAVPGWSGR